MGYPNFLPAPFQPVGPRLSKIVIAYQNPDGIADLVLPRVPVDTPDFAYTKFNKADLFTVTDDKVDRKSEVNQIDRTATNAAASVVDHALDEVVPRRDQQLATAYGYSYDPKELAAVGVATTLALNREFRAAALIFNPSTYASGNATTLTGTAQWSDHANSDPLAAILAVRDAAVIKYNQLVLGRQVATQLQTHPKIVQAFYGNNGQYGLAPLSFIGTLLGIEDVLIGDAWQNASKKGQPVNLTRLWGKSAALLYTNKVNPNESTPSFGITAQWGDRMTGEYFDFKRGMRGSDIVRVGESVGEVILANDLGYLFQNAVA